jgi:LmbE family N-acetylglucosaminyl deacetylase
MRPSRSFRIPALAILFVLLSIPLPAQLRVRPVGELPGDVSLKLALRQLKSVGSFMETTAHPDDEDNPLLAMMSRGRGMRTTLVTATRGDGGQNEIGPEIFQALGVLRTEELLAVHRFDGAEQYFTRAIDFGFSFSIDESIEKWGHDEILGDFVRHIRTIRPDVIAGFLCGGTGGGQHHQASARLTVEAFRAAADPARYPEQIRDGLRPWQARRVFCTEGFSAPGQPAAAPSRDLLRVNASEFDPVLGRTYSELGLEGRSMHKCQGTSQLLLLPGASLSRVYRLKDTAIGEQGVAPKDMFEGIDTSVLGLAAYAGAQPPAALASALQTIAASVEMASQALDGKGPTAAAQPLATGLAAVRELRANLGAMDLSDAARYEIDFRLAPKERQFQDALVLTHGIRVEVLADDGVVVPGQPIKLSLVAGNNGPADVSVKSVQFAGFVGDAPACAGALQSGRALTCAAELRVGPAPPSTPYWRPRKDAARYDFEPGVPFGAPFRPTPFRATLAMSVGGADVSVERIVEYRYSDLFAGEKRMELQVVPAFDVRVSPEITVVPTPTAPHRIGPQLVTRPVVHTRTVEVTVSNNQKGTVAAMASLHLPDGWRAAPPSIPLKFERENEDVTVKFSVTPPASVKPGDYAVGAEVAAEHELSSSSGYEVVEYPHIRRRHVVEPAQTRVKVIDVKIAPGLKVGYVMGVGDAVPAAIEQLGADVHLIDAAELASGDLSRYNVIVTGVRAYERRPDLRANNNRLLKYVDNGGTVVVQYNKQEFNQAQYGPYPVKTGTERITDENAPVEVLVPAHPVFNTPNKIGPEAWAGWVQERGTYFLADRDSHYVDLVRSTDPFPYNAGAKTGALVEARYGKGRWIYVGLVLWRQLPAGTEGAYQLMANLLSLGKR